MATITLPAVRRAGPNGPDEPAAAPVRPARRRPPIWLWLPALIIGVIVLLPLVYLVARASEGGDAAWFVIARPKTVQVVLNTVALVASVAVSSVVIAVPLAWLTTRTDLPGRRFWATVSALPLVIPSYVGALVFVAALGPRGMLARAGRSGPANGRQGDGGHDDSG